MAFNPITVNKGPSAEPHIYAEDDAAIFQSMFGEDGILDIGSKLKLTIQSNNLVRMSDGALCVGGHIGRIKYADYVDLTIDNGETGYNRNDLIIGSFSNTGEHTVDTFEPKVVKGTPATGTAVDPTLTKGSLYEEEHLRQVAVARVRLEGLNIVGVDTLLPVIPSIPSLKELVDELNGNNKVYKWEQTAAPYGSGTMTVSIYRIGRSCFANVTWTGSTLQSGETLGEFSIPTAFRPIAGAYGSCMNVVGVASAETSTRIWITNNGTVQYVTDDTRSVERRLSISYLAASAALPGDEYLV